MIRIVTALFILYFTSVQSYAQIPLSGSLGAPGGTSIVLSLNGKMDLPLSLPKETGKKAGSMNYKSPTGFPKDSDYKATIKKSGSGQTTAIYEGSEGKVNDAAKIKVGSDYTYDLLTRSSDDQVTSTFYETMDLALGGYRGEEGRYAAFISVKAGLMGSSGKYRQLFWRDRNTGVTKLISLAPTGEEANGDSYAPSISADGKIVVFESVATNLVSEDKNGVKDIFIWRAETGKIELVSNAREGKQADAESFEANISGNGQFVAFTSTASNLVPIPKGESNRNVFLKDLAGGKTTMISVDILGAQGGEGLKPSISFDGNRIAFYSHSSKLVRNDNNGLWDIFLWEKGKAELKRISLTHDGKERDQGQESANRIIAPSISGNGRFIAYTTTATNVVPGDVNNLQDVFIYDTETNTVRIASNTADGKPGNGDSPIEQGEKIAITYDGSWVTFSTKSSNLGVPPSNFIMHNVNTGTRQYITNVTGSTCGRPIMSYSGSYVAYGIGAKLDPRFGSSGIFATYTGKGPCRSCE